MLGHRQRPTPARLAPHHATLRCVRHAAGRRRSPALPPALRVWRLDLADPAWDVAGAAELLSPTEQGRGHRGTPEVRRRRVLLRAGLRVVLGSAWGVPPVDLPLVERDGRPVLPALAGRPRLRVSCSASGHVGLIAVAEATAVGIDVQRHDDGDALAAPAEGWLSAAEQAALARLPRAERLLAVTRCWTHKEAVLKGLGTGLRRDPATVETPVGAAGRIGPWAVAAVPVPDGYVATLALRTSTPPDGVDVTPLRPGDLR